MMTVCFDVTLSLCPSFAVDAGTTDVVSMYVCLKHGPREQVVPCDALYTCFVLCVASPDYVCIYTWRPCSLRACMVHVCMYVRLFSSCGDAVCCVTMRVCFIYTFSIFKLNVVVMVMMMVVLGVVL